jgi:hypothetical protein
MIRRRRRHAWLGLALGVIAVAIAIEGTAIGAAKGPKAITATQRPSQALQLPPQATNAGVLESTVPCPGGTTVTGGGGLFAAGTALTTSIALFESGPDGNGWHVRYDNDEATGQAASNGAICLKNKLKVKGAAKASSSAGGDARTAASKPKASVKTQQITQQVQLPPQATNAGVAEFTVNCPAGTTLVGGGALFAPGTPINVDTELFESGPAGNGWHVRWNNNQAINQGASLTAICMNNKSKVKGSLEGISKPKARTAIQALSQQVQLPTQATNLGIVESNLSCPSGTTLVGGGAKFGSGVPTNTNIELFESGPVGNSWHARWNNNTAVVQPASIHANCIKNKLKVK